MIKPEKPLNEHERVAALKEYGILDTLAEDAYDDLVAIVAGICGAPMGAITLIDDERQWFKSTLGLDVTETSRDHSFCAHAILQPDELLVVEDTNEDPRFSDSVLARGIPNVRFYAGAPLKDKDGHAMGTLCVMDAQPRQLSLLQKSALHSLSRQVSALMELRRASQEIGHHLEERDWYEQQLHDYQAGLELQNAQLAAQTRADPLTGLANRRALNTSLEAELARARALGTPLALAMCDIDHFKKVNDAYGHPAGDRVLIALAAMLQRVVGNGSIAARCGGEEFALLLPGMDATSASALCESILALTAALPVSTPITISIGLVVAQPDSSPESLYADADAALYAAKQNGRNRLELLMPTLQ